MKIKASIILSASLLTTLSCFAADTYQISTFVYAQGQLLASPTMVVEADKMESIVMDNGFSYNLTVKPNQDGTAGVLAAVTVGENTITPSLTVEYGKEARLQIGNQQLKLLVSKVSS